MSKSFRELRVWQASMDLSVLIYTLTAQFPKHEVYGLSSQMRRAAVSIASNIAEGSARNTRKDFRQFVVMAKGSTCELQTQLMLAGRLGYSSPQSLEQAEVLAEQIASMLSGLSDYLNTRPPTTTS